MRARALFAAVPSNSSAAAPTPADPVSTSAFSDDLDACRLVRHPLDHRHMQQHHLQVETIGKRKNCINAIGIKVRLMLRYVFYCADVNL